MDRYLRPTELIESDAPAILELAATLRRDDDKATAIAAFDWVRDRIRYDPYTAIADERPQYRATAILARGSGYCVQKAVLLTALCRAAGIPTRLRFADVKNHKIPPKMLAVMGTNLFVFHGYVELHLDGRWVKAAPVFDPRATERAGTLPVELDGESDAMLHPVDPAGQPYIEYVRDRGPYDDVPFDEIRRTFLEVYGPPQPPNP
jgi:transglutaminase-like putative cysteine protease